MSLPETDALIDFDSRIWVSYIGNRQFDLWLTATGRELPRVTFSGEMFKKLLDDRHTICAEPIWLIRDGCDVVIQINGEEWGRLNSETLRSVILRAVRSPKH